MKNKTDAEIRAIVDAHNHQTNGEIERIIKKAEKENPLKTYKCPKCQNIESVHYKNEKKIKRCLNCNTVIQDDRDKIA